MKKEVYTVKEATLKLMRFCTYRERCHQEVEQRLNTYKLTEIEKQEVISQLIANNFLNEERFAKIFAYDKFNLQKWGKVRITRELKSRSITDYLITQALREIDNSDYLETFQLLLEKKLNELKNLEAANKKSKLINFLVYKGYEYDLIFKQVNQLNLS